MFGKYGIDFGPEAHKGFSDREWKLACEFFDLMLHLPLTEDEDEWDSFFDWALSEVFDVMKIPTMRLLLQRPKMLWNG